ncbi:fungal trichothecene efflux pump (TRI12) domain-containing protein [Hirsutella rhossiliensis]|uniref:Fungal trichothecene efflux pump (TRI12) domain-containing protein n=1 Tax=Hirsutella rhossiliensis TaxID=111463 RepID=A0A9P8MMP2_9HYPO|nr:fungal trichothecene efflux pump (TRI12) domain-containing protein [Hirsutella rhossiliensis]KAH0958178.1 fungal trichothecene efflux pump (TRI12) domain-containing protein [Hirsutella rhossiliensis]
MASTAASFSGSQLPVEIKAPTVLGEASHSDADESIDKPRPRLHAKTFMAVGAVCLIYLAQLVNLVGAGAQGQTIAAHFNSPDKVLWFSAPVTILTVVLGPIVSQAADYWGRKWFLVTLTTTGAIGSILVARASTVAQAIAGFCVIGISFGVQPLLHTVTSEVLPRRWRAWGQAADMVSNGLGSIWGLLLGGAFNRTNDPASDGFRRYWLMTMAWYVAAVLLCIFGYNPPETAVQREYRGRFLDKLKRLDWIGYLLLAAGLVLFCVALSWSQNPYPWTDAHVSATFAVGLGLALILVGYETLVKKDGMFHHGLFTRNRNFPIALFCVFAEGVAFFAANIYFAFQVSVLYETDAVLVGVRYSIMLICSMIGAVLAGLYCDITRRVRWVTVLAFIIFVAFFACMATTTRASDKPVWGYPVLLGLALGMTLTTLVTVAQLSTPPQLIAIASGLIISVRSLGGTIGIAIYNALFTSEMRHVSERIAGAVLPLGLSSDNLAPLIGALSARNQTALQSIPGVSPEIIQAASGALLDTYVLAFRHVWIAAACFVTVAAIAAVFLFDPKSEFNMNVDAPVEKEMELYSSSR